MLQDGGTPDDAPKLRMKSTTAILMFLVRSHRAARTILGVSMSARGVGLSPCKIPTGRERTTMQYSQPNVFKNVARTSQISMAVAPELSTMMLCTVRKASM